MHSDGDRQHRLAPLVPDLNGDVPDVAQRAVLRDFSRERGRLALRDVQAAELLAMLVQIDQRPPTYVEVEAWHRVRQLCKALCLEHQDPLNPGSSLFGCLEQGCLGNVAFAKPCFQVPESPVLRFMAVTIDTDDHGDELVVHENKTALTVMAIAEHAHGLERNVDGHRLRLSVGATGVQNEGSHWILWQILFAPSPLAGFCPHEPTCRSVAGPGTPVLSLRANGLSGSTTGEPMHGATLCRDRSR
jgi:hypothetical protein